MRYKQFFDIIEFVCSFNIELQLRFSTKHFKHCVQKLLSCKSWKTELIAEFFATTIASFSLFYLLNFDSLKYVFLKKHQRAFWLKK